MVLEKCAAKIFCQTIFKSPGKKPEKDPDIICQYESDEENY